MNKIMIIIKIIIIIINYYYYYYWKHGRLEKALVSRNLKCSSILPSLTISLEAMLVEYVTVNLGVLP